MSEHSMVLHFRDFLQKNVQSLQRAFKVVLMVHYKRGILSHLRRRFNMVSAHLGQEPNYPEWLIMMG